MTRLLLIACVATCIASGPGQPGYARAPRTATVVQIDSGRIAGTADSGVASFKGIPYAAPPVGALANRNGRNW